MRSKITSYCVLADFGRSTKTRDRHNVRDVIVTGCHGFSQYSHGIRCWNHILQDCGRWLTDKGCSKKEINCYKDHLRCIFGQDSREKSLEAINQLQ